MTFNLGSKTELRKTAVPAGPLQRFVGFLIMNRHLKQLHDKWYRLAKKQFDVAASEPTEIGKRVMEHGAMVYFNCANELRANSNTNSFFSFFLQAFKKYAKRP